MTISRIAVMFLLASPILAQEIVQPVDMPVNNLRSILIEADSGSLALKASVSPRVRGEIRFQSPRGVDQKDFAALTSVEGSTLVISTRRTGATGIPVQLQLDIPEGISVSVSGQSLFVKAEGFESPLRIQSISGDVEILNSIGATTVDSASGNISVTLRAQPRGDQYFNTDSGLIKCSLDDGLSLKSMIRSGTQVSWGTGVVTSQGSLERTLGKGGPLMFASSRANKVAVELIPSVLPVAVADTGFVIKMNANWVYMNVIARDSLDRAIPDLRRESFNVIDNGVPVDLRHFESLTEPFHLLLLFDVSGSIKPHITLIRQAARQFIRRARKGDEIAIATFSSTSQLIQPFTSDLDLADKALNELSPAGGTAIYDAVYKSITEYMSGVSGRKAIVLFTDGIDNSLWGRDFGSTHSFNDLMKTVKTTDCLIYPIFVQPVPGRRSQVADKVNASPTSIAQILANATGKDPKLFCGSETNPMATPRECPIDPYEVIAAAESHLEELAEQTGGRIYSPRRIEDLIPTYGQIASDLDTVYTIGFTVPNENSGEWHDLKVTIRDFPLAITRTRRGYYSHSSDE